MDPLKYVKNSANENEALEYKDARAESSDLAEELVALTNSGGGILVLGITEDDGEIVDVQNVENPSQVEESINQVIAQLVEPRISFDMTEHEYEGKRIISFSVDESNGLHSYEQDQIPVYPTRQGSTTTYLHGREIAERLNNTQPEESSNINTAENTESKDSIDVDFPNQPSVYFTNIDDGHIAEACTFSKVYWPTDPYQTSVRLTGIKLNSAIDILSTFFEEFEIDTDSNHFTIHQQGGAWFGKGYENFLSAVSNQDYRYSTIPPDVEFQAYKTEQAIFVGELSYVYPNTTVIMHVERYTNSEKCRRLSIELLLDGIPINTQPIDEFTEKSGVYFDNAKSIDIEKVGYPEPSNIPADTIDLVESHHEIGDEEWISGAVCRNPFHNRDEELTQLMELSTTGGICDYQLIPARMRDHHPRSSPKEYDTVRFLITEISEFADTIPMTIHNIEYEINW
ncbi:AlbA family DNA-binding domain-containing protein [Haloarcula rubripromontorii]|uniref:AlbA family DNA-binding domain-containing protein n=1 Tax=Haloarcula rubripromontorii TaxID=1705562 RepID=UPI00097C6AC5|nr:ATP-binding protein [Haloarcula rubripromontorii]